MHEPGRDSSVSTRSTDFSRPGPCFLETVRIDGEHEAPERRVDIGDALSRHIHDLKNLLWPMAVRFEDSQTMLQSPELPEQLGRMGRDLNEALAIATRMGEIVRTCSNQNSTFFLPPGTDPNEFRQPTSESMRILFVGPDPDVSETVADLLEHLGQTVDRACSWTEAVPAISRREYSIMIVDMRLGDKSCIELTRAIREHGSGRVIWLTEIEYPAGVMVGLDGSSPDGLLVKPLSLSSLRELVGKYQLHQSAQHL